MRKSIKILSILVVLLFLASAPFAGAVERMTNGGFETTLNSWSAVGWTDNGNMAISSTAHSGAKSALLTYSASVYQNLSVNIVDIQNFTCWVKKETGNGITYLIFETSDDGSVSLAIDSTFEGYDWTELDLKDIIDTDGDTGVLMSIGFLRMDDNFVNYYFDDFSLNGPALATPTPAPTATPTPAPDNTMFISIFTYFIYGVIGAGLGLAFGLVLYASNRKNRSK
jgi:hypothetical protein